MEKKFSLQNYRRPAPISPVETNKNKYQLMTLTRIWQVVVIPDIKEVLLVEELNRLAVGLDT
jgi:hypothetical protein